MTAVDPGQVFIKDYVAGRIKQEENTETENGGVPNVKGFDDDTSCFTSDMVISINARNNYRNIDTPSGNERAARSLHSSHVVTLV